VQGCQENSNILPFGTGHIEEGLLKIILHVNTLHSELEDKVVPPCLHSGKGLEPNCNGIGKWLQQQVPRGEVFKLPVLNALPLIIWDLVWVLGRGAGDGALKVGPPLGHLHCFVEMQDEYGPIGAICLEARDVGGKLMDCGRSSHIERNIAAMNS